LKPGRAALALASSRGEPGARDALAALHRKIGDVEFEIECNGLAYDLTCSQDGDAFAAWRAAVQQMEPEQIIEGISRSQCCHRCLRGAGNGCVITASAPSAGGTCGHPILERHLFTRNETGKRIFSYRNNPQASKIFDAACEKLKVRSEFA
jgi:hypothetical protein